LKPVFISLFILECAPVPQKIIPCSVSAEIRPKIRDGFSCGVDRLDRYLRTQASQDVRRKANGVFILVEPEEPDVVLG